MRKWHVRGNSIWVAPSPADGPSSTCAGLVGLGATASRGHGPSSSFRRGQIGSCPKQPSIHAVALMMTVTLARMHVATAGCSTVPRGNTTIGSWRFCEAPFSQAQVEALRDTASQQCGLYGKNSQGMQNTSIVALTFHSPLPCAGTCFLVTP